METAIFFKTFFRCLLAGAHFIFTRQPFYCTFYIVRILIVGIISPYTVHFE